MQRTHCRDLTRARRKKKADVTIINNPTTVDDKIEELDAPHKCGDLVAPDSINTIKRSSTSSARHGDTTALIARDRGTGWIAAYPAKRTSVEELKLAVHAFKGSEAIKRWYSDGAPELHATCRNIGIRHDTSDPHRSETNGAIERCNRTVIQGARCLLFQSGMPCKYWKHAIKCLC